MDDRRQPAGVQVSVRGSESKRSTPGVVDSSSHTLPPPPEEEPSAEDMERVKAIVKEHGYELLV